MIWFRRAIAVFLAILFFGLFTGTLVITHVNETVGSAGFYQDQLAKNDVYNFVYDEALPAALDEVEQDESGDDFPVDLVAIKSDLVSSARESIPPDWLQAQFEGATDAIIPYFLGSTDTFSYTFPINERFEATTAVIKTDIIQGHPFASVYGDLISYAADKVIDNLDKLPYSLQLTKPEVETALTQALAKDWMASQLTGAIDSMEPYMSNDSERFTVAFEIGDQIDAITAEATTLISTEETYDYLLDETIGPTIEENLDAIVYLPFDVDISREEISDVVEEVMPAEWTGQRLEEITAGIASYAKGETDTIDITIDLSSRKDAAQTALTALANDKLEALYDDLRPCSMAEFLSSIDRLAPGELPDCRPFAGTYEQFKSTLGIDVDGVMARAIDTAIMNEIPDQWAFSDDDLRESLGEDNRDFLDTAREYVTDGWMFTEQDLLKELEPDTKDTLDDVRGYLGSGYTITEQDLVEEMDADEKRQFDDTRSAIDSVRSWLWLLWLGTFVLLFAIALLGGRNWLSRLAWALVVVFVCSTMLTIATTVAYSSAVEGEIEDEISEAFEIDQHDGLQLVLRQKGKDVAESTVDDFVSGLKNKPLYAMILSGVGLLGLVGWIIVTRRGSPGFPSFGRSRALHDGYTGSSDVESSSVVSRICLYITSFL